MFSHSKVMAQSARACSPSRMSAAGLQNMSTAIVNFLDLIFLLYSVLRLQSQGYYGKKLSWLLRHSGQFDCRGWMEISSVLAFLQLSRDALEAKQ